MNAFVNAIKAPQEARTENGMKAFDATGSKVLDLFSKIGTARGRDLTAELAGSMAEDTDLTARVLLWARDVREGAGERATVRNLIKQVEKYDVDLARGIMKRLPELGRWDDLLFSFDKLQEEAFEAYGAAIFAGDALAAKWAPREKSTKGRIAAKLRKVMNLTPREYRQILAKVSATVEQSMSAKKWDEVNYSHVPSVASMRYKAAFAKNDAVRYNEYLTELSKPAEDRDPKIKVNAGAIFPHDVVHNARRGDNRQSDAQWAALPDFVGNANVLPIVDTSGSMDTPLAGGINALTVAISLGLYFAEKNKGPFKDIYLTFSDSSQFNNLKGTLTQKIDQMVNDRKWGGSTNLHSAFDKILSTAIGADAPQSDMPDYLLILSDMEFNWCVRHDDSALQMIKRKYHEAGYKMPAVIFWNLTARNESTPVKMGDKGTALVSGFSPAIVKSILTADAGEFEPYGMMIKTISGDRYKVA